MKNKLFIALSLIITIALITGVGVFAYADSTSGTADSVPEIQRVSVNKDKTYYAYYNNGSNRGAVAFCLDNKFTSYGESQSDMTICTKNDDGTYNAIYTITKDNITTWFSGKQEYSLSPNDNLSNLLGGLSGIGISVDFDKTNVAFTLCSQPLEDSKTYYVYIPQDYFIDSEAVGNSGAYIELEGINVNAYSGSLCNDIEKLTNGIYDIALFGIESLISIAR